MTADISRLFADPDKIYRTVVRQQGRLPTDAEENHAAELAGWAHDAEFTETIAPLGTPDDGFKISVAAGVHDAFEIGPGAYYLGGARIENPAALAYGDQVDGNWLTEDAPIAANSRVVVWLEAEERVVTAVQDGELLEPALRGPDSAGRTRMCWRVRQALTEAADCEDALAGALGAEIAPLVDPETGAILSPGTLTIGFDDADVDLDLCKPAIETGYLGNRNNCFRIKRSRAGRFVWGEDNGAQLYRVTVAADKRTIHFLTPPRDEYLRPKVGQTIELLRGDLLLPNFERVAEPHGQFLSVTGGYSGDAITVGADVDAAWIAWLPGTPVDPDADPAIPRHFYLRVWTGGGEGGQPDIAFTAGTPKNLTGTGLTATFTGTTIVGDGWSCAARPDAPARVLPWALAKGMRAHGPHRHVAALAIVELATGDVHDCRTTFRPLHRLRGCCSISVGPSDSHQGDTESIAAAIAMLPPEGGTICLLAGEHRANVTLFGRSGIRFQGCPGRTRWLVEDSAQPLVTLIDTFGIGFHDIRFESDEAPSIVATKSKPLGDIPTGELIVEDCVLIAPFGCAIIAKYQAGARLLASRVEAGPFPGAERIGTGAGLPAIFLQGTDLVIEKCQIVAPFGPNTLPSQRALGGIQIGGGSERVLIRDCIIRDGSGIGITLGSILLLEVPRDEYEKDPQGTIARALEQYYAEGEEEAIKRGYLAWTVGFVFVITEEGCIGIVPVPGDPTGDRTIEVPVSEGLVEDIAIEHNRIVAMGNCGIATYPLSPFLTDGSAHVDAIAVARLYVANNAILDCMRLEARPSDDLTMLFSPLGGIALTIASDCLFRGNEIAGVGAALGGPIVGIGILYGEDIRIEANRIERNGGYNRARIAIGPNAGISAGLVVGGLAGFASEEIRKSDRPALHIHGNIVSQPAGRAIRALAIGPVMIVDNRLTGGNPSRLFVGLSESVGQMTALAPGFRTSAPQTPLMLIDLILDLAGGDVVNLVNLGVAEDLFTILLAQYFKETTDGDAGQWLLIATVGNTMMQQLLPPLLQRGGETMFDDNQVSLRKPEPDGPPMSLSSIFIASLDDISFADNEYEVEANRVLAFYNALLFGASIRTNGNRGQEAALCWRSILSRAILWNTAGLNQTTAGIDAMGLGGPELIGNRAA